MTNAAVLVHLPDARSGSRGDPFHVAVSVLHDELRPRVDVVGVCPAVAEFPGVEVVVDVHPFDQMEQEEGRVRVSERGEVRHRAGAGDSGIALAEVDLVAVEVHQEVEFEVSSVAEVFEFVAERHGGFSCAVSHLGAERAREDLVAAPAALVWREFLESDEFGHQGADDGAPLGHAGLDRRPAAADPLHHFDFGRRRDLVGVFLELRLVGDEERGVP